MTQSSNVPPLHDLRIYRGDDFELAFQKQDEQENPNPQPNVTEMKGQIRDTQDPTSPLQAEFTCDFSNAATEGTFLVSLTGTQTASLKDNGYYDIQIVQDGRTRTLIRGGTEAIQEVTVPDD